MPIDHRCLPHERTGDSLEGNQVTVIGDHEHLIAGGRHAAVRARNGISGQSWSTGALIMPYLASTARIERIALVGVGNIHHAIGDNRGRLYFPGITQREDPLWL